MKKNSQQNLMSNVTSPIEAGFELISARQQNETCGKEEMDFEQEYETRNENNSFSSQTKTHFPRIQPKETKERPSFFGTSQNDRNQSHQTERFEQDYPKYEEEDTVYPSGYKPKISEIGKFLKLAPLNTCIRNNERLKFKFNINDKDFVQPLPQKVVAPPTTLKRETQKTVDLYSFNQAFFWTKGDAKQSTAC